MKPVQPFRVFYGSAGSVHQATLALTVGSGAWYTSWAIFLTRSVGLSAWEFGVGVTVAGILSLLLGSPAGYLADRVGVREILVVISLVQGVATVGYVFVRGFWTFVLVACVAVTAQRILPAIRMALISGLVDGPERVTAMSTNRVVSHAGMAVGAAVGGLVLYFDTRPAYVGLILLYSVAAILSALLAVRVPHVSSLLDRKEKRRVLVAKDVPFLVVTMLFGVLALNWGMLAVGVPLWITTHTGAPAWIVGVITVFNAAAIVLFQNRSSRMGRTVPGAARAALYSGAALSVACLLFATSYHRSGLLVIFLLLLASAVHVVGELYFSTSSWGISVGLTPRDAHGEYQTTFAAGYSAAELIAPLVMTSLLVGWGPAGWLLLAVLFVAGSVPIRPISRWAMRTEIRKVPLPRLEREPANSGEGAR
ncbi:MAG: MFS transporter [Spirillospora sp.]